MHLVHFTKRALSRFKLPIGYTKDIRVQGTDAVKADVVQQRDDRTRLSLQAAESHLREFGAWSHTPKPPACLLLHCVGGTTAHLVGTLPKILWVYVYAKFYMMLLQQLLQWRMA